MRVSAFPLSTLGAWGSKLSIEKGLVSDLLAQLVAVLRGPFMMRGILGEMLFMPGVPVASNQRLRFGHLFAPRGGRICVCVSWGPPKMAVFRLVSL